MATARVGLNVIGSLVFEPRQRGLFIRQRRYDMGRPIDTAPRKGSATHSTTLSSPIAEHEIVRVTRSVEAESYSIPKDTSGTVVAVFGHGVAYAVEIADLPGGPEVVTLRADQIERMH
jgi:hypothetical protein